MQPSLPRAVGPGAQVRILHPGGEATGLISASRAGWIELQTAEGTSYLAVAQITRVDLLSPPAAEESVTGDDAIPVPRPKPLMPRPGTPGRPWSDEDLRELAHAFLDGGADGELAERFGRSRHQITTLRQGFDAARGDRTSEDCSPVAQTWIPRFRRALGGDRPGK
jgi:hypothetical protein